MLLLIELAMVSEEDGWVTESVYDNETIAALRDQVRRFVAEEVRPHGDAWEAEGMVPRDALRKMGELGFFGIRYPETYGGSNLDTIATAVMLEEIAKRM